MELNPTYRHALADVVNTVDTDAHLIGVISDTHGLLRPQAISALRGSNLILHAGDVGRVSVLEELRSTAPVHAVRGNVDKGEFAAALPSALVVRAGNTRIIVVHDLQDLARFLDDELSVHVVISGHSHRPSLESRGGMLYLNPGSAGPRRFRLPVTVAHLHIGDSGASAELCELEI